MSRRRGDAAKRKKRKPFQPTLLGLEKRMMPTTFVVLNATDSGVGSLRQAILNSNSAPGSNTIDFGIATGAQTISLLSALPNITVPVNIDGTTQPGYTGAPLIDLDGTGAGSSANGLVLATGSGGTTIRAIVISNFAADGILITSNGNAVQASYVGLQTGGSTTAANAEGILIAGANNTIGGTAAGVGNAIAGNTGDGVELSGSGTTGNLIAGNWIGTNSTGSQYFPNATGVEIDAGASGNTIGGTAPGAGDEISGNSSNGVELSGTGVADNVVLGDDIGTNAAGTIPFGNGIGIYINSGASSNTIGGTAAGARDVIDASANFGIELSDAASADNVIAGDYIGPRPTGRPACLTCSASLSVTRPTP